MEKIDSQSQVKIKHVFVENILNIEDKNTLKVKKITVESIIDYPMSQSV